MVSYRTDYADIKIMELEPQALLVHCSYNVCSRIAGALGLIQVFLELRDQSVLWSCFLKCSLFEDKKLRISNFLENCIQCIHFKIFLALNFQYFMNPLDIHLKLGWQNKSVHSTLSQGRR